MEIIQITDLHISKDKSDSKHDCVPYDKLTKVLEHISAVSYTHLRAHET